MSEIKPSEDGSSYILTLGSTSDDPDIEPSSLDIGGDGSDTVIILE